MTDPRVQSAQDDVTRYAEDAKRKLAGDPQGGWWGDVFGTIREMGIQAEAMAAGAMAGEMALNPDYLSAVTKQFNQLQDIVTDLKNKGMVLTNATPLGLGYGEAIGADNGRIGQEAGLLLEQLEQKIATMLEAVKASVANYQRVEDGAADGFKKM